MSKYSDLKTTKEFMALLKKLYTPPTSEPTEINVPDMNFISILGTGSPASEQFQRAVQAVYAVGFSLKMGLKFGKIAQPADYFDYKMPPLEGQWWQDDGKFDTKDRTKWRWRLLLMLPSFVNQEMFEVAKDQARVKRPELPFDEIFMEAFSEGPAVQIMHHGPYSEEPRTLAVIMEYIKKHGYQIQGKHHEVYLGDPRRTKPDKLRTVLRYPVIERSKDD